MPPEKFRKGDVKMKLNQAYNPVTLAHSSRPVTQIRTKPCVAYEGVVHAHH